MKRGSLSYNVVFDITKKRIKDDQYIRMDLEILQTLSESSEYDLEERKEAVRILNQTDEGNEILSEISAMGISSDDDKRIQEFAFLLLEG